MTQEIDFRMKLVSEKKNPKMYFSLRMTTIDGVAQSHF